MRHKPAWRKGWRKGGNNFRKEFFPGKYPAGFLCPSVLHARHIGHNRIRSPTIARRWGPCRPHKECKDTGEDICYTCRAFSLFGCEPP